MPKTINETLAIIILVVIAAAVGGYILWQIKQPIEPTQQIESQNQATTTQEATQTNAAAQEMAGWKTYASEKWGYQIKYPVNFYIKGNLNLTYPGQEGGLDFIVSNVENMGIQDVGPNESVHVDVYTLPAEGKSLNEYVQGKGMKSILLGGIEAFQSSDDVHLAIYAKKGNFIYVIRGENKNNNNKKIDVEKSWEIMKTFRFVD